MEEIRLEESQLVSLVSVEGAGEGVGVELREAGDSEAPRGDWKKLSSSSASGCGSRPWRIR